MRPVGWCSIVTLPPVSQTACAAGAIAAGSAASTPTEAGARPSVAVSRVAAIRQRGRVHLAPGAADRGLRFAGGHAVLGPVRRVQQHRQEAGHAAEPTVPSPLAAEPRSRSPRARCHRIGGVAETSAALPDSPVTAAVAAALPGARADLERLVRIPSIWADPAHAADTAASAEAVAELARAAGAADVEIISADGGAPAVLAHWPAPGRHPDGAALRPPRRAAHRRRRALDQPAVRADRAGRPALRPRRRRRQGRGDDPPGRAARLRRPPAGRGDAVRRGRGGVRLAHPHRRCWPSPPRRAQLRRHRHRRLGQPGGRRARR